jgi:hypothetical protein
VHTGEILERDVLIAGRHIAAVTPPERLEATAQIDATRLSVYDTSLGDTIHPWGDRERASRWLPCSFERSSSQQPFLDALAGRTVKP